MLSLYAYVNNILVSILILTDSNNMCNNLASVSVINNISIFFFLSQQITLLNLCYHSTLSTICIYILLLVYITYILL